jgi:hypothetical protein
VKELSVFRIEATSEDGWMMPIGPATREHRRRRHVFTVSASASGRLSGSRGA